MEAVRSSRRMLLVLLAVAIALVGLAAYAAFPSGASGQGPGPTDSTGPTDPALPSPVITVQSDVVGPGECFVTTQKELEGPVLAEEEIFEPLLDADGEPVLDDQGHPIFVSTGEFRDVLREIEIIKVISACNIAGLVDFELMGYGTVQSNVEVFIIECGKDPDLRGAHCKTNKGEVVQQRLIDRP